MFKRESRNCATIKIVWQEEIIFFIYAILCTFLKNENIDGKLLQESLKTFSMVKEILLGHLLLDRIINFIPFY